MRLFVAIEVSPEIRNRISEFVNQAKHRLANARWVRPEGLHVTLKFLGNVADDRRVSIESALQKVKARQFELSVRNIGFFPNPKSPRVLWVGLHSGPELASLAEGTDEALTLLGFEREKRAFTPHVTLARFMERSRTRNVNTVLPDLNPSFGTMTAKEFHLYESKLSPKGASYSKIASFPLH